MLGTTCLYILRSPRRAAGRRSAEATPPSATVGADPPRRRRRGRGGRGAGMSQGICNRRKIKGRRELFSPSSAGALPRRVGLEPLGVPSPAPLARSASGPRGAPALFASGVRHGSKSTLRGPSACADSICARPCLAPWPLRGACVLLADVRRVCTPELPGTRVALARHGVVMYACLLRICSDRAPHADCCRGVTWRSSVVAMRPSRSRGRALRTTGVVGRALRTLVPQNVEGDRRGLLAVVADDAAYGILVLLRHGRLRDLLVHLGPQVLVLVKRNTADRAPQ